MRWTHTPDHSDLFYEASRDIATYVECDHFALLSAANAESGVSAKAENPRSSATGLLQWMEMHWKAWGFTRAQFAAMPADQQVHYVRRYLKPYRGLLPSSAAIYTAIFLPAYVLQAKDPDYVLCARGAKLGWAYTANAIFDRDGDGRITVSELDAAIRRNWTGPRCLEMMARAEIRNAPAWAAPPAQDDLRTTIGVQRALIRLGYDLGPMGADNVPGLRTRTAVVMFQRSRGLTPDALVGPRTRAALLAA